MKTGIGTQLSAEQKTYLVSVAASCGQISLEAEVNFPGDSRHLANLIHRIWSDAVSEIAKRVMDDDNYPAASQSVLEIPMPESLDKDKVLDLSKWAENASPEELAEIKNEIAEKLADSLMSRFLKTPKKGAIMTSSLMDDLAGNLYGFAKTQAKKDRPRRGPKGGCGHGRT